jgi:hypothetical protein
MHTGAFCLLSLPFRLLRVFCIPSDAFCFTLVPFPDAVSLSFPPPLPLQLPQSINTSDTEQ